VTDIVAGGGSLIEPGVQGEPVAGVAEVCQARRAVEGVARRLAGGRGAARGTRAEWAELVAESQRLVNVAAAVQDAAIARLAAIEDELLEDGTLAESPRLPGHIALDAPDVVAGVLGVSHAQRTGSGGPRRASGRAVWR
jgi:hypothetical protein